MPDKTKLEEILSEIGVEPEIIAKKSKSQSRRVVHEAKIEQKIYNGVNAIGDISKPQKEEKNNSLLFIKYKKQAQSLSLKANLVFVLFCFNIYLIVANMEDFPLWEQLLFFKSPYIFTLANITLLILALCCSAEVIYEGIKVLPKASIYTFASFISLVSLTQMLSVIFLENSVGYFPFSSIAIMIMYFATKELSNDLINTSYVYRLSALRDRNRYVTNSQKGKFGYIAKTIDEEHDFCENIEKPHLTIYFYLSVVIAFSVGIYMSNGNISLGLWVFSAVISTLLPLNFVVYSPNLSKQMFRDKVAIKSVSALSIFRKQSVICVSDYDLFPDGSITIDGLKLYGSYDAEQILRVGYAGFAILDSATKLAFRRELTERYISPIRSEGLLEQNQNGFTFLFKNKKVSIGNSAYALGLGHSVYEATNATNPTFFIVDGKIVAIASIKYTASPEIYDLIEALGKDSLELLLVTVDFNIKSEMVKHLFNVSYVNYPEYSKRYALKDQSYKHEKAIMIKGSKGYSYFLSLLYMRTLNKALHYNIILGSFCLLFMASIVTYLCYTSAYYLLLPQNIAFLLFLWFVPSIIVNLFNSKI